MVMVARHEHDGSGRGPDACEREREFMIRVFF